MKTIKDLKEDIKRLSEEQKIAKQNRKTVHLSIERTMSHSEATWTVQSNRSKLRHMYLAYGLLRGRTIEQIESNSKTEPNIDLVNKLKESYGKEIVCDDAA